MELDDATDALHFAAPPPGQPERRAGHRYPVVEDHAWLGWWDGPSFVTTPSRVLDLGLRGALLAVDAPPLRDRSLWFCPPSSPNPEWLEAALVQSSENVLGQREVRITFRRLLPYDTFKTLVYGNPEPAADGEAAWPGAECDRTER